MEDRFRFRAWSDKYNRYLSEDDIYNETLATDDSIYTLLEFYGDSNKFIFEQCTGLKDKNGKLIYEGDILKIGYYNGNWKVLYEKRLGKYCLDNGQGHKRGIDQFLWDDIEIVGNIHEKPLEEE